MKRPHLFEAHVDDLNSLEDSRHDHLAGSYFTYLLCDKWSNKDVEVCRPYKCFLKMWCIFLVVDCLKWGHLESLSSLYRAQLIFLD